MNAGEHAEPKDTTSRDRAPTPIRPGVDRYSVAAGHTNRSTPTRRERFVAEPLLALYWWVRHTSRLDATSDDLKFELHVWQFCGNRAMARCCRLELSARRHPANVEREGVPSSDALLVIVVAALLVVTVVYLAAHVLVAVVR